jgi:hypothetical protein
MKGRAMMLKPDKRRDCGATPRQRQKIAQLAMACGERQPIEDGAMSMGEAGKVIRVLERQVKAKRIG